MAWLETEVLIVGGGVLGTAVARELSRYKVNVALLEKEADLGWGSTKANMCIVCQGGDALEFRPEYKRSRLVWDSIPMMEPLCRELGVPFKRIGELILIRNNEERAKYQKLKTRAERVGITDLRFIGRDELLQMEPNITRDVVGALYNPAIAVVDPVRLTIALAENAQQNGVQVHLETEVLGIEEKGGEFQVQTNRGPARCRFIVNAAGIHVDRVARFVNADEFVLYPIKGFIGILDKELGSAISHELHMRPEAPGEMNIVVPSVYGNPFYGVVLRLGRKGDNSATREMAHIAFKNLRKVLPWVTERDVIHTFAGFMMFRNWELGWHECVVEASRRVPRFINVSIGYPGVSAAPATAQEVIRLLQAEGLKLEEDPNFNPTREAPPSFADLPPEEQRALIERDQRYGRIVCRCETVTEGEVVEAIRRGATTLDGVKFRTRAGMGRCQGGYCTPRVLRILAKELGIPETQVTKKGKGSELVLYRSKELLEEKGEV